MKKYIIVSIIVAALFVGGSIGIAKALPSAINEPTIAKKSGPITLSIKDVSRQMATGLKYEYNDKLSSVTKEQLSFVLQDIIRNTQVGVNDGLVYGALCDHTAHTCLCWKNDSNGNSGPLHPCTYYGTTSN